MQFYRKWINTANDNLMEDPNNQIMTFFKKLGFVQLDGSEYTLQNQNIRWRYDNWQTTDRKLIWWSQGGFTYETHHRYGMFKFSDDASFQITPTWYDSILCAFIGFPLKNRGFYIMDCADPSARGGTSVFNPNYPPKLVKPHQKLSSSWLVFGNYLIGYYNNLMNEFNYLCFKDQDTTRMDYNYGVIKDVIWDSSGSYTDGKKNICTLIKYPTQDGFMDNLYLISTSPNTVTDGYSMSNKFFSFGGRNFYCSDYNLVFELPAN